MNKRIVIFSAFFEPHLGGVERYVKELSSALEKKGAEIMIITSDTDNLGFYEKNEKIQILRLRHKFFIDGRLPLPFSLREVKKTEEIIKSFKPDAVILNMRIYPLILFGAYVAHKNNIPAMLIDHVSGYFQFTSFLKAKLSIIYEQIFTVYLKKRVHSFYGVSGRVNEWLNNFGIIPKGVIHNGVKENPDLDMNVNLKKYNIHSNKFSVFFAGRIIEDKGVKYLCDAYMNFRKSDTQLIICGDGPLLKDLKSDYKNDDIIFTGQIKHTEVMTMLKHSDVAVIPSFYPEGLPTIILEAGISNCGVLSTDSGGAKEVIRNEYNGIIIEKKSESSISDNLELLYNNRNKLQMYSDNLYKTIKEQFIWSKIADKLIQEIWKLKN